MFSTDTVGANAMHGMNSKKVMLQYLPSKEKLCSTPGCTKYNLLQSNKAGTTPKTPPTVV
jgi:hypothetical protein